MDISRRPKDLNDAKNNLGWTENEYELYRQIGNHQIVPVVIDILARCDSALDVAQKVALYLYQTEPECYWGKVKSTEFLRACEPFAHVRLAKFPKQVQEQLRNSYNEKKKGVFEKRYDERREEMLNRTMVPAEPLDDHELTFIIQAIAHERLPHSHKDLRIPKEFDIDNKIDYNHLQELREKLKMDAGCDHVLQKIYDTFESEGKDYNALVVMGLREVYLDLVTRHKDLTGVSLFCKIRDVAMDWVKHSANREGLAKMQMERGVGIVLADAFMRCEIFREPLPKRDD